MTDEIPKNYLPTFNQNADCSAALGKEVLQHLQSDLLKNHCPLPAAADESMQFTRQSDGSIQIEPFIAVRLSHSEVEPARIGLHGLIEESKDMRVEETAQPGAVVFPEGLEGEGHVGVIIKY
ncbi:MAG: hypothetical protein JST01_16905 [Cyanobacteria bacterium SZAS TMP-1]|nr:hypothetical protein [Cyanobacteria bacterium SZAS TMP-1]